MFNKGKPPAEKKKPFPVYCSGCGALMVNFTKNIDVHYDEETGDKLYTAVRIWGCEAVAKLSVSAFYRSELLKVGRHTIEDKKYHTYYVTVVEEVRILRELNEKEELIK